MKQCSSEGLTNVIYNIRNVTFNTPTFGFVCHAEYKQTSLGSVVYPSSQLRAIVLVEAVLAEASATLSAGEGCDGDTSDAQGCDGSHEGAQQDHQR